MSPTSTPTMRERRVTSARANAEGEYWSAAAAASTRCRVAGATGYSETGLNVRETVVMDTPALRATSTMPGIEIVFSRLDLHAAPCQEWRIDALAATGLPSCRHGETVCGGGARHGPVRRDTCCRCRATPRRGSAHRARAVRPQS